jgi:hypothetical protein
MIQRTTVRLPRDLLSRAKRKAAAEHSTLTALIEEGLRLVVSGHQRRRKSKRILPRHSDASGPPFRGIDISNSAALQGIEDLEYSVRLKSGY